MVYKWGLPLLLSPTFFKKKKKNQTSQTQKKDGTLTQNDIDSFGFTQFSPFQNQLNVGKLTHKTPFETFLKDTCNL